MALTAIQIKTVKATDKPQKFADGGGMYLLVRPNGAKYWRLDYRFANKRKTLAIGVYPDISLSEAREPREAARTHHLPMRGLLLLQLLHLLR